VAACQLLFGSSTFVAFAPTSFPAKPSEALSAGVPPGDDRLANRDDVDRQRYGQAGRTRTGANWSLPTRQPMTWSLAMGARRDMAKDPRAVKSALRRLHHPEESSVLAL